MNGLRDYIYVVLFQSKTFYGLSYQMDCHTSHNNIAVIPDASFPNDKQDGISSYIIFTLLHSYGLLPLCDSIWLFRLELW